LSLRAARTANAGLGRAARAGCPSSMREAPGTAILRAEGPKEAPPHG